PSVAELPEFGAAENDVNPRTVLFFGTPFLLVRNLPADIYIERLNSCLDYVRRHHPRSELFYRPHPFETTESRQLKLDGFRIQDDRQPAEVYFLENFNAVEAVYSVSSGASRRALTMGLNAYSFWRCFPFPESAAKFFETLMGKA